MTLAERHSAVAEWAAGVIGGTEIPATVRAWPGEAAGASSMVVDVRVEGVGIADLEDGHFVETALAIVVSGPMNLAAPAQSEADVMTVVSGLLDGALVDQSLGGRLTGEAVAVAQCDAQFHDVEAGGGSATSAVVSLVLRGRFRR